MRKHLFGLAIFISIVTAAVFVYGFFNAPPIPVIPAVEDKQLPRHPIEVKIPSRVGSQLVSILFDEKTEKMIAVVELEWSGTLPKPTNVRIDFGLVKPSSPRAGTFLHTEYIKEPFSRSSRVRHEIEWKYPAFLVSNPDPNRYVYIGAVDQDEEFHRNQDVLTVLVEKDYLALSVPLLIKHAR